MLVNGLVEKFERESILSLKNYRYILPRVSELPLHSACVFDDLSIYEIWQKIHGMPAVLHQTVPLKYNQIRPRKCKIYYIDGLVQACSNSIANALELQQSCAKPSIKFISYTTSCI